MNIARACPLLALVVGLGGPWRSACAQGLQNGSSCQHSVQCESLTCVDLYCCVEGGGYCSQDAGCCQDSANLTCNAGVCGIPTCGITECGAICGQDSDCQWDTSNCNGIDSPPWNAYCQKPYAQPNCGLSDAGPGCNACLINGTDISNPPLDGKCLQSDGTFGVCPEIACCSRQANLTRYPDSGDNYCCSAIAQSCHNFQDGTNDCCGGNNLYGLLSQEESCGPNGNCCANLNYEGCRQNSDCCGNNCADAGYPSTYCASNCQYSPGNPY